MRKVVLALGVLALVVLATFLLRQEGGRGSAVAAPRESEPQPASAPATELAPIAAPVAETREVAEPVAVAPAAQGAPAQAGASVPDDALALAGTIVVVDEQGVEHPAEDGSFSFVLWTGDSGSWHEVRVNAGSWSTAIPREPAVQALGVTAVRLGGRRAVCGEDLSGRIALPADGWLALAARWPSASSLSVRDRESGRELAPVFLTEVQDWPESEFAHPGPAAANERDLGASPVTLPPGDSLSLGTRTCYARSPGYAWGRIEIDETHGGERVLLLERAGELEVEVLGAVSVPGTKLRLFGGQHAPVFESELATDGVIGVEALPTGPYRVKAEVGNYWSDPLVLAEAEAEVVADARVRVTLTLKELEPRLEVPFEGTLVLPAAWELGEFELGFELLDTPLDGGDGRFSIESTEMQPEGKPPETYRWSAPAVQPGRYEVELDELAFHAVLTVGDAGLRDARVVVPPPCDVLVRCIDDDTGAEVTSERVSWYCAVPEGLHGWSNENARWDEALRRWRIRAPQGEVVVSVYGNVYAHISETVQVHAGTNEVLLRLARATSLRVSLRDGTSEIPWPDDVYPELEPAEGQADHRSWSRSGGRVTLHKKEPGRYTLKIPELPGYEPVPALEVRLEKGVVTEHVVELVRKR